MNRSPLVLAVALCLSSGSGVARDAHDSALVEGIAERAKAAIQAGNYAQAYCAWEPLAQAGHPDAQLALGWMYHKGWGLAIDDRQAAVWWTKAAEQGQVEAKYALGSLYSMGSRQVERDLTEAVRLWSAAAQQGHEDAQIALRQLAGRGIPDTEQLFMSLLAEQPDIFGEYKVVASARANVRQGPGTNYRIVAVFEQGQTVFELLQRGDWVKVGASDPPRIAWIYRPLLAEAEPAEGEAQ